VESQPGTLADFCCALMTKGTARFPNSSLCCRVMHPQQLLPDRVNVRKEDGARAPIADDVRRGAIFFVSLTGAVCGNSCTLAASSVPG
jgi:hypothetical protein